MSIVGLTKKEFVSFINDKYKINYIIKEMYPLLNKYTKIILKKTYFKNMEEYEFNYTDIFQELQVSLWKGLKKYDPDKNIAPFFFINTHLSNVSKSIGKAFNCKKRIQQIIITNITEVIKVDKPLIDNEVLKKCVVSDTVKSLPDIWRCKYIKLLNNEQLSNKERVGLKNFIKNNSYAFQTFKEYFNTIL
jgi:hypothetical protein